MRPAVRGYQPFAKTHGIVITKITHNSVSPELQTVNCGCPAILSTMEGSRLRAVLAWPLLESVLSDRNLP